MRDSGTALLPFLVSGEQAILASNGDRAKSPVGCWKGHSAMRPARDLNKNKARGSRESRRATSWGCQWRVHGVKGWDAEQLKAWTPVVRRIEDPSPCRSHLHRIPGTQRKLDPGPGLSASNDVYNMDQSKQYS
ncbi:hypothetical protein B0T22DRAFT_535915 [Podospora appendiculata]|uniref:Uncharacterized protein n=1 Tax=Podospora appendiculata TaxID=314037 RepID=A0AAE1CCX8_9PEZI|nr:hypothetical protein B0T22DRAFT_535915 [Podospora appendiculata]